MKTEMTRDEYLGLLQAIAEGVSSAIAAYRNQLRKQDDKEAIQIVETEEIAASSEAAGDADESASEVIATAMEKTAEQDGSDEENQTVRRRRTQFPLAKMLVDVLQASADPLSIDGILKAINDMFGAEVKRSSLNVAINLAMKKGEGVVRAGRGAYSFAADAVRQNGENKASETVPADTVKTENDEPQTSEEQTAVVDTDGAAEKESVSAESEAVAD